MQLRRTEPVDQWIRLAGPNQAVEIIGIRLVGVNAENGAKLLISLLFVLLVVLLHRLARRAVRRVPKKPGRWQRVRFWARQSLSLTTALILGLGLASIWFDDARRLATALGVLTAVLAFALQRVVTAVAAYLIILRGKTFKVGDRIVMGGVRGDVIALRLTQTTIMEMGQPPAGEDASKGSWVHSRQYTGRIVTVSNARIFDEPVYNFSGEFPYVWEEIAVPIRYDADRDRAEKILLQVAARHTRSLTDISAETLQEMRRRYFLRPAETTPAVYYRLTDNWLELTVRFIVEDREIREIKDGISRDIVREFEQAGIAVASQTLEILRTPSEGTPA